MGEARERADLWLARESTDPEVVVVGLPWAPDTRSLALSPLAVRDRLHRFSTYHAERDIDFGPVAVSDMGNWPVSRLDPADLALYLRERIVGLPSAGLTLFLGGAEDITRVLLGAFEPRPTGLIRFSSAPLAGLSKDAIDDVVLVGVHGFTASATSHAESAETGAVAITTDQIEKEGMRMTIDRALGKLAMCDAIHVSVDLDALDTVFAPTSPDALPGGLTTRQLSDGVRRCAASGKVRSMDLVGADTAGDASDVTIDATCHLLLSAVAGYAERR